MATSRYNKGYNTKGKIIQTAKELFYRNGYNKVTTLDICKQINIKNGNLTYYFAKKQDLATTICSELMVKAVIIADQYAPKDSTLFQRNCIGNFICTIAQFADDNTTRFTYEIAVSSFMPLFLSNSVRRIYSLFNTQMGLGLDEKEFQIVSSADTAVRIELQLDMLRRTNMKPTHEDCIELASNMQILMGRLFKMNEAEVLASIELAKDIVKDIDFTEIKLLL